MPTFDRDGLSFRYRDEGTEGGLPFVFQHGLGSDIDQPFRLYPPPDGVRLIGFDFRGHGQTRPLGDEKRIGMASFADDLIALLDWLEIDKAVLGGISLGAAVALNAALRYPQRAAGLVLSRPAWIDRPYPENARSFTHVAVHLLRHGAEEGLARYRETAEFQAIRAESPAMAASLEAQFTDPRAVECVARLERVPHDAPCREREELSSLRLPTLVMGNRLDPIHPWEFAEALAGLIPNAELVPLTPKSWGAERHADDVKHAIDDFLGRRFLAPEGPVK